MAHKSDLIAEDILAYLKAHEHKGLLRFITCGSVDARGGLEEGRHAGR